MLDWLAFVLLLGSSLGADTCDDCTWAAEDAVLCSPHAAADEAAAGAARQALSALSAERDLSDEQRLAAIDGLVAATQAHANAPSRVVGEVLMAAVDHPSIVVRIKVAEALAGQHPELATTGILASGAAFLRWQEELFAADEDDLGLGMLFEDELTDEELDAMSDEGFDALLAEGHAGIDALYDELTEIDEQELQWEAWLDALFVGLESLVPTPERDEWLSRLAADQGYPAAQRAVSIFLATPSPSSLRRAVEPVVAGGVRLAEESLRMKRLATEGPAAPPPGWEDDRALWEDLERVRIADELLELERFIPKWKQSLADLRRQLQRFAADHDLPGVPDDAIDHEAWAAWSVQAAAALEHH